MAKKQKFEDLGSYKVKNKGYKGKITLWVPFNLRKLPFNLEKLPFKASIKGNQKREKSYKVTVAENRIVAQPKPHKYWKNYNSYNLLIFNNHK